MRVICGTNRAKLRPYRADVLRRHNFPRALPWADMRRAVGAQGLCPAVSLKCRKSGWKCVPLVDMNLENREHSRDQTRFSRYVKDLSKTDSVLITRNGRPCAALVPVTEDTDLEALALSQNKRFWKLIDDAIAREKKERLIDLNNL
jgi:prevent-host-death family protein